MRSWWKRTLTLGLSACLLLTASPAVPAIAATPTASTTAASSTVAFYNIQLGMTGEQVTAKLGAPIRKDPSQIGVQWWIYNKDLNNYLQVGIQNNRVVTLYSNGLNLSLRGMRIGMNTTQLAKIFGQPKSTLAINSNLSITNNTLNNKPSYLVGNQVYTFMIDKLDKNKVVGVRLSTKEHFAQISYGLLYRILYYKMPASLPTLTTAQLQAVATAYERQNLDLTNIARKRVGLPLLTWNSQVSNVARAHSLDMVLHNFFEHSSPTTGSPFDRLHKAGVQYYMAGENIAAGQLDSIEVHNGWMNSSGHRVNLLQKDYKEIGIGTVFKQEKGSVRAFYTQNFVTRQ
ncbi:CAP-associated domain-containing protein [Brevibacillus dissolubilis]|uniref:CAP domain-containing protein n=1 Tax=Brevibacillus dissolubilis TaxID=1844116 RepID=UPI001117391A|nr:CAP-associated domain-containing protein [Brevibacillus dissolubilis]